MVEARDAVERLPDDLPRLRADGDPSPGGAPAPGADRVRPGEPRARRGRGPARARAGRAGAGAGDARRRCAPSGRASTPARQRSRRPRGAQRARAAAGRRGGRAGEPRGARRPRARSSASSRRRRRASRPARTRARGRERLAATADLAAVQSEARGRGNARAHRRAVERRRSPRPILRSCAGAPRRSPHASRRRSTACARSCSDGSRRVTRSPKRGRAPSSSVSEHAGATARRDDALDAAPCRGLGYARAVRAHLDAASELALARLRCHVRRPGGCGSRRSSGANPLQLAVVRRRPRRGAGGSSERRCRPARAPTRPAPRSTELEREIERAGVRRPPHAARSLHAGSGRPRATAPARRCGSSSTSARRRHRRSCRDRGGARGGGDPRRDGSARPASCSIPTPRTCCSPPTDGARAGPRLADALVPAIERRPPACPRPSVRGLLVAIGLGESDEPVVGHAGGRFRNGVLRGAWHKPAAAFIGHARARGGAARTARRAAATAPAAARVELSASEQQLAELARRHAELERELTELPSDAAVRDARQRAGGRRGRARAR